MHFAVVDVEVQRAVRLEHAAGLDQARFEEGQVIVEDVGVGFGADLDRLIAAARQTRCGPRRRLPSAHGLDLRARLGLAGVEGRVDVDEIDRRGRERLEDGEVVGEVDAVGGHKDIVIEINCTIRIKPFI